MEIIIPAGGGSSELSVSDFEKHPIPLPPCDFREKGGRLVLTFNETEEAVKYGLHLGDVYERMEDNPEYKEARAKIKLIVSCINEQVDFGTLKL